MVTREPDQSEDQSTEVTLTADGGQTTVVWEERGMPVAYLAGYGAGIQVRVEDLGAHLAGRERCDAGARTGELFPAYEPLAAKVSQGNRRLAPAVLASRLLPAHLRRHRFPKVSVGRRGGVFRG